MTVSPVAAVHLHPDRPARPAAAAAGGWLGLVALRATDPAPRPDPRPVAGGLEQPLFDGAARRVARLAAAEAARGFSEGNCLIPGDLVNRRA